MEDKPLAPHEFYNLFERKEGEPVLSAGEYEQIKHKIDAFRDSGSSKEVL